MCGFTVLLYWSPAKAICRWPLRVKSKLKFVIWFFKFSFCLKPKFITKIAIKTSVLKERGSETKKKKLRLFNIYLLDDTGYLEYITKWPLHVTNCLSVRGFRMGHSYGYYLVGWAFAFFLFCTLVSMLYIDFINGLNYIENFFKEISWITKSILSLNPYTR